MPDVSEQPGRSLIQLIVEPVPASSAHAWITNANHILDRLVAEPAATPFRIPPETVNGMRLALAAMQPTPSRDPQTAAGTVLSFETGTLRDLITYWFNITKLTEAQRSALGVVFGDPQGEAFGQALAAAVGAAMVAHPDLAEFASRLAREWEDCQPGFSSAALARGRLQV